MRIGCINTEKTLVYELSKISEIASIDEDSKVEFDALFIDWIPLSRKNPENTPKLLHQAQIVEKYIIKKIPTVIFDRHLGISSKEYNWLRKFNVSFCEPALDYRRNFIYLPFWTILKRFNDIPLNVSDRKYSLVYKGSISDKTRSFEKYFLEYSKVYPDDNICYWGSVDKDKEKEYIENGLHRRDFSFSDAKFTIIIGSVRDYKVGYLDSGIMDALNSNCVPMIPDEHRYYTSLPWVIPVMEKCCVEEIHNFVTMYDRTYVGLILDVYNSIRVCYPEMDVTYTAEMIVELLR